MFQEWGFLLTEIWSLLALAGVLGLASGWLMFGQKTAAVGADIETMRAENAKLQSQIVAFQARVHGLELDEDSARPIQLNAPEGGLADELQRIKGITPRIEQMCNMLGFWHYAQIAQWTDAEVAWVEENLQGVQANILQDHWIQQAKILGTGGETAFSKKFDAAQAAAASERS